MTENIEKDDSRAISTLLTYFGDQTRAHATNILSLTLILFTGIQATRWIFNTENSFVIVFMFSSVISSVIFWQYWRLIYYASLSSYVTIMDPIKATKELRYAASGRYRISTIRKLYDASKLEVEKNHPLLHRYFHTSGKETLKICIAFAFTFFSNEIIGSHILQIFTIIVLGEQLSLLEMIWLVIALVDLVLMGLIFFLIYKTRSKLKKVKRPKNESQANELIEQADWDIKAEDYDAALSKLIEVKEFAKESKRNKLLVLCLGKIHTCKENLDKS